MAHASKNSPIMTLSGADKIGKIVFIQSDGLLLKRQDVSICVQAVSTRCEVIYNKPGNYCPLAKIDSTGGQ